jgi:hypothetical protein
MASFWCVAHREGTQWEALCLDLDIAVHGPSFPDVKKCLEEAVFSYIKDAMKEDEPTRTRLLHRRAPLSVRLPWALRLFFRSILSNKKRDSDQAAGFPISCPA